MKPLFVLLIAFAIAALILKLLKKNWNLSLSGRIAMSCMLVFTAIGHFTFSEGMSMMLPDFIPFKRDVILLTGILEIGFAVGLLIGRLQRFTSILLIVFFICVLPSNIYAAFNHIDIEKANFNGPGLEYLWIRIPLQILFIGWVYFSGVKKDESVTLG